MCHYLTVRCLLEAKEYSDALQVINESEICTNITQAGITFADRTDIFQDAPKNVRVHLYLHICVYTIKYIIYINLYHVILIIVQIYYAKI